MPPIIATSKDIILPSHKLGCFLRKLNILVLIIVVPCPSSLTPSISQSTKVESLPVIWRAFFQSCIFLNIFFSLRTRYAVLASVFLFFFPTAVGIVLKNFKISLFFIPQRVFVTNTYKFRYD
jgi:hypothetical protein